MGSEDRLKPPTLGHISDRPLWLVRVIHIAWLVVCLLWVACGHVVATPARRVHRDIAYVAGGFEANMLDVYTPAAATGAPVIVWFHGGCPPRAR